jgi:hypothetical protein
LNCRVVRHPDVASDLHRRNIVASPLGPTVVFRVAVVQTATGTRPTLRTQLSRSTSTRWRKRALLLLGMLDAANTRVVGVHTIDVDEQRPLVRQFRKLDVVKHDRVFSAAVDEGIKNLTRPPAA